MSKSISDQPSFVALIELQLLPRWYELDVLTRQDYGSQVYEILRRHPGVTCEVFDGDAWTGEFSDFVICEFRDLDSYNALFAEMRSHPFLATPFARLGEVLMGIELDIRGLAQLREDPPEAKPVERKCKFCDHRLKPTARFCSLCGRDQE
ncbi:MAG: hypothetical protein KC910_17485 [Candidatus Eremiobacteraeota bacterium]|nr:hypothetical protein [Candidatus Eremiobacteraeota bacterium]